MHKKLKIIFLLLVINLMPIYGICQNNDNMSYFNTNVLYYLPPNRDGLTESAFTLKVKVVISRNETTSDIIIGISHKQGTALNPDPSFKYGYSYQGKQYGDGTLGKAVFEGIRADLLRYKVIVHCGAQIWERVIDGVAMVDRFGPVAKNTKASEVYVVVEVASLDYGGGTGTDLIEKKIGELLKASDTKKRYDNLISQANSSFSSNNWQDAKNKYQQASSIFPDENYPKDQIEKIKSNELKANADRAKEAEVASLKKTEDDRKLKETQNNSQSSPTSSSSNNQNGQGGAITNMSGTVKNNGEEIKVYQQNGKYYMQSSNGTSRETTQEFYNGIQKADNNNKANREQYNDQVQAVNATNDKIKAYNDQIAKNNEENRKLNDPLAHYNPPTNSSGNNNPMTNSNSTNNTYTEAANSIGSALTQWGNQMQADNAAEAQRQEEREEREEQRRIREKEIAAAAAEMKANKLLLVNNRKSLIAKFPDGKTPLSYQAKEATEVYYFAYSYEASALESNAPVIYISNVFSIAKYGDGTWPFKASLMEKISKTNKGLNLILSGYYLNQNEAEQQQEALMKGASNNGFMLKGISYVSKKSSQTTDSNTDYWGNTPKEGEQKTNTEQQEPQQSKTNSSEVDYWGNPIKKGEQQPNIETPTQKEPEKPKAKFDRWGNPIKD